jgi:hypothetical protein
MVVRRASPNRLVAASAPATQGHRRLLIDSRLAEQRQQPVSTITKDAPKRRNVMDLQLASKREASAGGASPNRLRHSPVSDSGPSKAEAEKRRTAIDERLSRARAQPANRDEIDLALKEKRSSDPTFDRA